MFKVPVSVQVRIQAGRKEKDVMLDGAVSFVSTQSQFPQQPCQEGAYTDKKGRIVKVTALLGKADW